MTIEEVANEECLDINNFKKILKDNITYYVYDNYGDRDIESTPAAM